MSQSPPQPSIIRQTYTLWERTLAAYLESLVRNPLFLGVNSGWLSGFFVAKKVADGRLKGLVSALGLSTRKDQLRVLHLLNNLEARLDDIETVLETIQTRFRADASSCRDSFAQKDSRGERESGALPAAPPPC
jgi:hypothetical protein